MAIGPILREARQQKQLTASQVAEITRMKVQIVDDLENDDFHRIAATIYGKGFIKLYAECVDLDPEPLLADYMEQVGAPQPPKLPTTTHQATPPPTPAPENTQEEMPETPESDTNDLFSYAAKLPKPKTTVSADACQHKKPALQTADVRGEFEKWSTKTRKLAAKAKNMLANALDVVVKKCTESGEHDKWIQRAFIALGILIAILILIPLIRMMATPRSTAYLPDDELILFVPPPEPYLE